MEWHKGKVKEALEAWKIADDHLKRHKLPAEHVSGNQDIYDICVLIIIVIAIVMLISLYHVV